MKYASNAVQHARKINFVGRNVFISFLTLSAIGPSAIAAIPACLRKDVFPGFKEESGVFEEKENLPKSRNSPAFTNYKS